MRLGFEDFGTSEVEENADGTAGGIVEVIVLILRAFKPNRNDEISTVFFSKAFDKQLRSRMA